MTTGGDQDTHGFTAPPREVPTPEPIKAAGRRLLAYAAEHGVTTSQPLLDLLIPESEWQLVRDQRLLAWFIGLEP